MDQDVTSNKKSMVGIILLNYNTWKDTIECLESLLKLKYDSYRLIVVDNKSPNNSMNFLIQWADKKIYSSVSLDNPLARYSLPVYEPDIDYVLYCKESSLQKYDTQHQITFIQSDENRGYAAGNNIGIKHILAQGDCDYIWILNNDIVVANDVLSNTIATIEECNVKYSSKKLGIFGHKITFYAPPHNIQAYYYTYNKFLATTKSIVSSCSDVSLLDCATAYPTGASIFVTTSFVEDVGLMGEEYFLYYEEPDWSIRAAKKDYELVIINDVAIFHKEGASAGSDTNGSFRSEFSDYYQLRNRIVITRKFYSNYVWCVKIGLILALYNRIKRRQYNRLNMIFRMLLD